VTKVPSSASGRRQVSGGNRPLLRRLGQALIGHVKRFLYRTYIYRGFYGGLKRKGISTRENALKLAMLWSLWGLAGTLLGLVAGFGKLFSDSRSPVWKALLATVVCGGVLVMLVWKGMRSFGRRMRLRFYQHAPVL
jgi:hypothetical protein